AIDERETLDQLERRYRKQVYLQAVDDFHTEQFEVSGDKKPGTKDAEQEFNEAQIAARRAASHGRSSKRGRDRDRERGGKDRNRDRGRDRDRDREKDRDQGQPIQASSSMSGSMSGDRPRIQI